jgi:eukaryotic-like serine/threonine-protein kinase
MQTIELSRGRWFFDDEALLGEPGGFGAVYAGVDPEGREVAVKLLHRDAAGPIKRELRIAELFLDRTFSHVMPVLDVGYDEKLDRYAVVMARGRGSLESTLRASAPVPEREAAEILYQIALGLEELPDVIHRDLKPDNVLFHEGAWKISDFGLARLVEAATSRNTLKRFLSVYYAAPEQWVGDRSTHATDIYALGCIGYALVTGEPPFVDGDDEELGEQHLRAEPLIPSSVSAGFKSLLPPMLRKRPRTRPRLARVLRQLELLKTPSPNPHVGLERMAEAAAELAQEESAQELDQQNSSADIEERRRTAFDGCDLLEALRDDLYDNVLNRVPSGELRALGRRVAEGRLIDWKAVAVGDAHLAIRITHPFVAENQEIRLEGDVLELPGNDVLAIAEITVTQEAPTDLVCQRTLVYRKDRDDPDYRWREHRLISIPADGRGSRRWRLSSESIPIDDEDSGNFIGHWLSLLAAGMRGGLREACDAAWPPA